MTPELATGVGSLKATLRVGTYLMAETAAIPQISGKARLGELAAKLQWINVLDGQFQQIQNQVLIKAFNDPKFDIRKADCFGLGQLTAPRAPTTPVREYRIPATAPLSQYGVRPGATGKSIAPVGQKAYVLVEGGELTDPLRLGTALGGYEALGAKTIPVPKGVDGRQWMNTLGLPSSQTVIMKVTGERFVSKQSYSLPKWTPTGGAVPGGVITEVRPRIDRGNWPVVTGFTLSYKMEEMSQTTESEKAK